MIEKLKETIVLRPRFTRLTGATYTETDGEKQYTPIGELYVNPMNVAGFYDHTVLVMGNKLRVMETVDEIMERMC